MSRLLGENPKKYFFFELLPFVDFDTKCDISKTVTGRSSTFGQLIEGNEWMTWWKLKKHIYFFLVIAFAFFWVNALCKFGHRKLPIKISRKLLQLVASDLVSLRRMVNRLPGEQNGGQTKCFLSLAQRKKVSLTGTRCTYGKTCADGWTYWI